MAKTDMTHVQNLAEKAHKAIDSAASTAEAVELKAKETSAVAQERASSAVEDLKATGQETGDKVIDYVNKYPAKSLGIAFGAGLIAALLLKK